MENLELTTEEKKELKKRGFFVKKLPILFSTFFNWIMYKINLFFITFPFLVLFIFSIFGWPIWFFLSIPLIFSLFSYWSYQVYIAISEYFLFKYVYVISPSTPTKYDPIFLIGWMSNAEEWSPYIDRILWRDIGWFMWPSKKYGDSSKYTIPLINIIVLGIVLFFLKEYYIFTTILLSCLVLFFCYQKNKYLYAFGNLGEKIQKLTPKIEEQSKQIQSEFQSDMNFLKLSNWFDSLSNTFSEIVALVIKLEKVETRANKWNLFDSEKYINSLRLDIIEPLRSLREFLQNQKTKLLESKKELIQVQVWGSESTGNTEIQSKRSESLIQELTENIENLDVMIGKMI